MRVPVGDVELHVHELGQGRPLILLHGGPGLDGSVFFPGIDPLASEGWRLLAIDHRGNGRSDAGDPATWTVARMADDVEAVITALELERPVVLGWSFGSFVAQAHILRHQTAAGYVLMGTVAEPGALHAVGERLAAFEPAYLRDQVTSSWERERLVQTPEDCRRLLADQMPFHVADPTSPLVAELNAADRIVYRPEVLRHFSAEGDYGLVDQRAELARSRVPVLILSGAEDRTTPPGSAHELAELLPFGEEAVIAGAAHMMLYEQPEATLAALRAFLARV